MEQSMKLWFKQGYTDFDSDNGLNRKNPLELKRLNIIVGANNSGKSRFMREFAINVNDKLNIHLSESFLENIDRITKEYREISSIDIDLKDIKTSNYQVIDSKIKQSVNSIRKNIQEFENWSNGSIHYSSGVPSFISHKSSYKEKSQASLFRVKAENIIEELVPLIEKIKTLDFANYHIFYINSLRSLKKIQSNNGTENETSEKIEINLLKQPLLLRTYEDYEFTEDRIISGEDFFDFLTDSLLGMPEERQRVYEYQDKISHYFFNNQDVVIIPNRKDDILQIKIGDDKQFPISQLGDGLQQIIILTYKAFLTTEPSFFFIEEPEMHLHAGYVKQLMKFLLNETDHYYMATSHSNYLLDMINEDNRIALYRVDKERIDDENKYETVIKRCDGDRTILQTLGVSPSSVFLANCTIWIEGITDRLYFVQYLKKYLDELKVTDKEKWEDYSRFIDGYHYAFVEYQGSNLEHWDFEIDNLEEVDSSKLKGLNAVLVTSNALVIADADLKEKPRFNELEQQLGERIIMTQGKETENSISKKFLVRKFFEMCPDNGLARQGNKKKLAYSDDYEKYFTDIYQTSSKGIGKYFDNILSKMRKDGVVPQLENNNKSFTFSDGGQGTIKSKTTFCQDIVELMQSELWELTPSAIELCESIFQHIKYNNQ